ncbi:MFS transporter, DHA1 family, multidrug resistance protein [Blastomyces silverae]|uniref:MFS transporter, DHA1 family, multidrug resistance protein n=1 Tax=Blastomyces silverae TaxID=2060906 RepID=A0A0H1BF69_9EURO|nr:MFS transporter, DHA1 family, multidrug resistance protein [Blastomyces silverae]
MALAARHCGWILVRGRIVLVRVVGLYGRCALDRTDVIGLADRALNYIIDAYLLFAASAIAANTLLRSIAGAAFPLFSERLFAALGVNWTGTLLGCIAIALAPIPVIFYIYGARIRAHSKFSTKHFLEEDE